MKVNGEIEKWRLQDGEFYYGSEKSVPNFIIKGCFVKTNKEIYQVISLELEKVDADSIEKFLNKVVVDCEKVVKSYCITLKIDTKSLSQFKKDLKEGDYLNCSIEIRSVGNFEGKNYAKCVLVAYKKVKPPVIKMDLSFLD